MAIPKEVTLPWIGKVPTVAAGIGVGIALTGIVIYRANAKKKADAATAAATAAAVAQSVSGGNASPPGGTAGYPPDGTTGDPNDPNSTDPATGTTYGDESSPYSSPAQASSGIFPTDGTYGNPSDPYSTDPATGTTYGSEGYTGQQSSTGGPPFSTNGAWSQYVLNYYGNGGSTSSMSAAIGLYLAGEELNATQEGLIQQAIAIGGNPPVAGPAHYPPDIRHGGNKPGAIPVTVPNVVGISVEQADEILGADDLHPVGPKGVKGEEHIVTATSPRAGSSVPSGTTVTLSYKTVRQAVTRKPPVPKADTKAKVPSVTGEEAVNAQEKLTDAGFKSSLSGPAFKAGTGDTRIITTMTPRAGTLSDKDALVRLTYKISKGKANAR